MTSLTEILQNALVHWKSFFFFLYLFDISYNLISIQSQKFPQFVVFIWISVKGSCFESFSSVSFLVTDYIFTFHFLLSFIQQIYN